MLKSEKERYEDHLGHICSRKRCYKFSGRHNDFCADHYRDDDYVVRDRDVTEPKYVYVLELEGGNWYVGMTNNPQRRIRDHYNGDGATWPSVHTPVRVEYVTDYPVTTPMLLERNLTLKYKDEYGSEKVMGAGWVGSGGLARPKYELDE